LRIVAAGEESRIDALMQLPHIDTNRSLRLGYEGGVVPDDDEMLMLKTIEEYYRDTFPIAMQFSKPEHVDAFYHDAPRIELVNFLGIIGRRIWHRRPTPGVLQEVLGMFDDLSVLTYEGHPAGMTVMLVNGRRRRRPTVRLGHDLVASRKTARLFSGGKHVISATLGGEIAGIEVPSEPKKSGRRVAGVLVVASEYQALAALVHRRRGMSFALAENGDISIMAERRTIAVRQHGAWTLLGTTSFVHRLSSLLVEMKRGATVTTAAPMAGFLTMLALSLNRRREGALLVVTPDGIPHELLPRRASSTIEAVYQGLLAPQPLFAVPVSLLLAAMSIDGATFVSADRIILAFGQILVAPHSGDVAAEGARTRAAETASRYGIALKVSADGPITLYAKGEVAGELLQRPRTDLGSMKLQLLF
jgi:hypothetical protein